MSGKLTTQFGFGVRENSSGDVTGSSGVSLGSGGSQCDDAVVRSRRRSVRGRTRRVTSLPSQFHRKRLWPSHMP